MKDEEISEAPYLISKLKKMPAAHHAHRQKTAAQRAAEEWGFAERTVKGEDAVAHKKPAAKPVAVETANKQPILHAEAPQKVVESAKVKVPAKPAQAPAKPVVKPAPARKVVAQSAKTTEEDVIQEVLDPWHMF
jgi:hypothetical protein